MYYKPDWDKAKERMDAFWNNEIIDRCCAAIFSPRKNSKFPPFPELQWGPWLGGIEEYSDDDVEGIKNWWTDPEQNFNRLKFWFENTYFGGEAAPTTYLNWGAMAMAAFYGCEPKFTKTTVWYPPIIDDWKTWKWEFDKKNNWYWNRIKEIMRFFIAQNKGDYFVGTPELGTAGDLLSLMRGMDKLAMDLIDYPDEVKKAIDILSDTWIDLHEELYQMTAPVNNGAGVIAWMSLWAPGRHDQTACDFSSVLSPEMFQEFFVPEIKKECRWCEYSTYHLDGQACIRNLLDVLLQIDEVDTIQFTPGTNAPATYTKEYIPLYKKIQEKGKRLYLLVKPEEIEPLLKELSPKGLFLCSYAESEDEANSLLKTISKLSAERH